MFLFEYLKLANVGIRVVSAPVNGLDAKSGIDKVNRTVQALAFQSLPPGFRWNIIQLAE